MPNALPLSSLYRTAFVTGVCTGLGRAFADMLLQEGVQVWGTSRRIERLSDLEKTAGFTAVALDLRDGAAAEPIFLAANQAAGGFDIVINNAGYGAFGDLPSQSFPCGRINLKSCWSILRG